MSNYRFKLLISPEYIHSMLIPEQRERFNHIEIVEATLFSDGLEIECLALEHEVEELPFRQALFDRECGYITAVDYDCDKAKN